MATSPALPPAASASQLQQNDRAPALAHRMSRCGINTDKSSSIWWVFILVVAVAIYTCEVEIHRHGRAGPPRCFARARYKDGQMVDTYLGGWYSVNTPQGDGGGGGGGETREKHAMVDGARITCVT